MAEKVKPIVSKEVTYLIIEEPYDLKTKVERYYKVAKDNHMTDKVSVYTYMGNILMPTVDIPLLIKALQDYIK